MQKRLLLATLVVLVVIGVVAIGLSLAADSQFNSPYIAPYTQGHANAGDTTEAKCSSCHSVATGGGGYNAHATHKRTLYLSWRDKGASNYDGCGRCHTTGVHVGYEGDLTAYDSNSDTSTAVQLNTVIRKQVSAEICRRCHGGFVSSGTHATESINSNCLSCHVKGNTTGAKGADVAHAGVTWINRTVVDNTSIWQICTLCHGQDGSTSGITNRVWYQEEETNPTTWP
jgi:hypothetical protein